MIHIRSAPSLGGMAIAILPITDLVKTRNELKIQEAKAYYSAKLASLGEVAAGIAHEVNNPLTIIEGAATIIDMNVSGNEMDLEVVQKMSKKIMHTTQRINKLVKSLKKLSRKDSFEPFEKVSLQSIIEPSLEIMQAKLKCNRIDIKVTSDFSEVFVEGREVELSQVVMNLISNAADAVENQDQRWIELKHHANEDWCDILVTDSGRGVPLEIQSKIMEPFFTTKDPNKGTGLGLSISKSIVEKHFGELSLMHSEPNTTFRVRLPWQIGVEQFKKSVRLEEVHVDIPV